MRVIVLGASAGGGLPQWNCGCPNCIDARAGNIPCLSQSSVAVSANGSDWVILNASPDIRDQCKNIPALFPTDLRASPIRAVVLTNGDIDHIGGLLILREKTAFDVYATQDILEVLKENTLFSALDPELVNRFSIKLGVDFNPTPDLTITAFPVPGKVPLFRETDVVETELISEYTIGLSIHSGGKHFIYTPGCARIDQDLADRIATADLAFFDGTLWENEEMTRMGAGVKTGKRMGHVSISGKDGSMDKLSRLTKPQRVFIHINNTNPILQPKSKERKIVEDAGWTVAQDGMEFSI